jgi:hypothetical protein
VPLFILFGRSDSVCFVGCEFIVLSHKGLLQRSATWIWSLSSLLRLWLRDDFRAKGLTSGSENNADSIAVEVCVWLIIKLDLDLKILERIPLVIMQNVDWCHRICIVRVLWGKVVVHARPTLARRWVSWRD